MIAHCPGNNLRNIFIHHNLIMIAFPDFFRCMNIILSISASCINGKIFSLVQINICFVIDHHICPDTVHIHAIGIIIHIRCPSARRTHIHFQSNNISLFAQSLFIIQKSEKFQVEETASHIKSLNSCPSGPSQIFRQHIGRIVRQMIFVIDNIRYTSWPGYGCLKNNVTFAV